MAMYLDVLFWLAIVLLSIPYVTNDDIKPCGLKLCKERCDSLSYCSSPVYDFNTLACVLGNTNTTDTKIEQYRRIKTRGGRGIEVLVVFKNANPKKTKYSQTNGNFITLPNKGKETYKLIAGDGFSVQRKKDLIIHGICAGHQRKFYYSKRTSVRLGYFLPVNVTGIWVNTNEVRCHTSSKKQIVSRVGNMQVRFKKIPSLAGKSGKDFIIWAYTGEQPNEDCHDSIKEVKYHHYIN